MPMSPRLLRPIASRGFDADARAYIAAVEIADTQPLEMAVKVAINDFIVGCKADGIWNAISGACILAGARTLTGCLVPLKGPAPTPFNFASGDYSRTNGLAGNATASKYLNTHINNNASPDDDNHNALFVTQSESGFMLGQMTLSIGTNGSNSLSRGGARSRHALANSYPSATGNNELVGSSRSSSTQFTGRAAGEDTTFTRSVQTPATNTELSIFGTVNQNLYTDSRLAWYSVGTSVNLALLESRLVALLAAFGTAIP